MDETTTVVAHAEFPKHYGSDPVRFSGHPDALLERHLLFNDLIDPRFAGARQTFEAAARSVRDVLSKRWSLTSGTYHRENPKRIYYLSMEFLIGRSLTNNITNLMLDRYSKARRARPTSTGSGCSSRNPMPASATAVSGGWPPASSTRWRRCSCRRWAMACATSTACSGRRSRTAGSANIRTTGCANRIRGRCAPQRSVEVKLGCSFEMHRGKMRAGRRPAFEPDRHSLRPARRRLWRQDHQHAAAVESRARQDYFDFQEFSHGDFVGALVGRIAAETLTRVLYPDDSTSMGQGCVRAGVLPRGLLARGHRAAFPAGQYRLERIPDKVAIQLNDTHPTMAVPELMRILLDEADLGWDEAWDLTQRTLAYTNHTLLPEALENWPLPLRADLLPRQLEIIFEINRRFLDEVRRRFPGDEGRVERVSLIEEGPEDKVRMANLAIVGSHSTNGVAAIHSELLRATTVKDLAEMFPERFNNKTNGVTPRRWLLWRTRRCRTSSPMPSAMAGSPISARSRRLEAARRRCRLPRAFREAKREAKTQFADWLQATSGQDGRSRQIFDCQVKRIHEYKRQTAEALRIVVLYNRLREKPGARYDAPDLFFAGKAAPAYRLAKLIIKFINNLAGTIDGDPAVRGRLKVVFLPGIQRLTRGAADPGQRMSPTRSPRPASKPAARAT